MGKLAVGVRLGGKGAAGKLTLLLTMLALCTGRRSKDGRVNGPG
jgi:hypothetical protein